MDKIKFWVNILTVIVVVAFLDGLLSLGFGDDAYMLAGITFLIATCRLSWIVNKTEVIK